MCGPLIRAVALGLVCLLAPARGEAQPKTRVVVFPFAPRGAATRIFATSLAQAVAKAIEGSAFEAIVTAKRPAADDSVSVASDAAALGGALAVLGEVEAVGRDEARLRARLVDVERRGDVGGAVETRVQAERLDQGAAILASALRNRAEEWLRTRRPPESRPAERSALVYGVDVVFGPDGVDARVAATRTAYRLVRRELGCRPVPSPTYGLVPPRVAALAAGDAGCAAALMLRVDGLSPLPSRPSLVAARVIVRAVSADGRLSRERVLTFSLERRPGEGRESLASRAVVETFRRLHPELREVLARARVP